MSNPKIAPWQAVFRTIDESGYIIIIIVIIVTRNSRAKCRK
jgi:hypothetical protein